MSINHGSKNNELSDTLVTFLGKNINLAHIKLILLFVFLWCKNTDILKQKGNSPNSEFLRIFAAPYCNNFMMISLPTKF